MMRIILLLLISCGTGKPRAAAEPEEPLRSATAEQLEGPWSNRLLQASSPYLAMHGHDPVDWRPWGPDAMAEAERRNVPIFLSIGYYACHWCHVMHKESFKDPAVAAYMNDHFVPIKVDREERPDIDSLYMDAVHLLNQGNGGWPASLWLTPDGTPFYAGTYFPPSGRYGRPGFIEILKQISTDWTDKAGPIRDFSKRIKAKLDAQAVPSTGSVLPEDVGASAASGLVSTWDAETRGWGQRRQFPMSPSLQFLLSYAVLHDDPAAMNVVAGQLQAMDSGGIHDHLGGGFHRYTVDKHWAVPHFEKMLYDNGQLVSLFVEAAAAFGEPRYLDVARKTLDFMLKEMYEPNGGFYASYDADSGGEEGTFYVWTPKELKAIAGESDGAVLALLLGVTEKGNFEHNTSVVTRRISTADVGKKTGRTAGAVEALWAKYQPVLYEVRSKRIWPGLDKKLVTAWNGLGISGMAKGYAATGDVRYRDAATQTADLIWKTHRRPGGGLYRASNGGKAEHVAIVDDYGFLAVGFLDLFEATGEIRHLERTKTLLEEADARFAREEGGWYLTENLDESLITRSFDPYDSVRPSGNSTLLDANLRYSALTGSEKRHALVEKTLGSYASMVSRGGLGTAGWATVALMLRGPFYDVVFAGDESAEDAKKLKAEYAALSPSWGVRTSVAGAGPTKEQLAAMPPLMAKTSREGAARAYVCIRGTCKKPTGDPKELRAQILDGWTR